MTNLQFQRSAIDAGGCISNGWELVKPNYWIFFGMTALFVVGSIVVSCIPLVGGILFQVVLAPPLTVGIFYTLFRGMGGQPIDFGMMFKGFNKFGVAVVVGLIQAIPAIIWTVFSFALNLSSTLIQIIQQQTGRGYRTNFAPSNDAAPLIAGGMIIVIVILGLIFLLFSIAWGITFFFALPIITENDIGAIDAIKLSARAGWSNVGGIIVLAILEGLIAFAGFLALCIGVLFVLPVIYAATAFAYRQVFPYIEQNFNIAPPPPTEYGFGGGPPQY